MIANPVFVAVTAGIIVFLALCTVIGLVLATSVQTTDAREKVSNLNARIRAWWGIVLVFGAALVFGHIVTLVLFAILSFLGFREFMSLTPTRAGDHRSLFLSFFVVVPVQYWLIAAKWYGLFSIFIPVYGFLLLPALSAAAGDTREFLTRNARLQWGLMLTVYAISHAPALLLLDLPGYRLPNAMLLLYLMVVVQISDVFQYVFGKLFGRTKLSPAVSPSKTVEGLAGGGVTAVLIGAGICAITPFSPWQAATLSAVIVVGGFLGGFVLSAIKRDLGVKDWGRMIEGGVGRSATTAVLAPLRRLAVSPTFRERELVVLPDHPGAGRDP
jgi:phosphatidate cytidylyltransferase